MRPLCTGGAAAAEAARRRVPLARSARGAAAVGTAQRRVPPLLVRRGGVWDGVRGGGCTSRRDGGRDGGLCVPLTLVVRRRPEKLAGAFPLLVLCDGDLNGSSALSPPARAARRRLGQRARRQLALATWR